METPRTPKVGEYWILLPCQKHAWTQLRDVVVIGRDFEDQPDFIQQDILEHIRCGCEYPATDPAAAVLELRYHEACERDRIQAQINALYAPKSRTLPFDVPWLVLLVLWVMATAIYLALFRS